MVYHTRPTIQWVFLYEKLTMNISRPFFGAMLTVCFIFLYLKHLEEVRVDSDAKNNLYSVGDTVLCKDGEVYKIMNKVFLSWPPQYYVIKMNSPTHELKYITYSEVIREVSLPEPEQEY